MFTRALIATLMAGALLIWSAMRFSKLKTIPSIVQCFGAACLTLVALFHVCEALSLFPFMGWGAPDSPGHYLDFLSAGFGVILLPAGYLLTRGKSHQ